MYCEGCQNVKSIPLCSEAVTIGNLTIAKALTAVKMVIAAQIDGREWFEPLTTDAAGDAIFDFSTLGYISPNFTFSIKIIEGTMANYNTPLPITVDGVAYDCLYLKFDPVIDGSTGELTGAASITLEADL